MNNGERLRTSPIPYEGELWSVPPGAYESLQFIPARWNTHARVYEWKSEAVRSSCVLLVGDSNKDAEVMQFEYNKAEVSPPVNFRVEAFVHPDVAPSTRPVSAEIRFKTYGISPFSDYGIEAVTLSFLQLVKESVVLAHVDASLTLSENSPLRLDANGDQHLYVVGREWCWSSLYKSQLATEKEVRLFDRIGLVGLLEKRGDLWSFSLNLGRGPNAVNVSLGLGEVLEPDWFSRITDNNPQSPWRYQWSVGNESGNGE